MMRITEKDDEPMMISFLPMGELVREMVVEDGK